MPRFARAHALSLGFPSRLSAPNRIIAALARRGGESCYCSLRLRTGLGPHEFADAIAVLEHAQRVGLVDSPVPPDRESVVEHKRVVLSGF
jgi:hypothetical protein